MTARGRRLVGTVGLTLLFLAALHGVVAGAESVRLLVTLVIAPLAAAFAFQLWLTLDLLWQLCARCVLTWRRLLGAIGIGMLLMAVIVVGGRWFGLALDPGLVLNGLALGAYLACLSWPDPTIRERWR